MTKKRILFGLILLFVVMPPSSASAVIPDITGWGQSTTTPEVGLGVDIWISINDTYVIDGSAGVLTFTLFWSRDKVSYFNELLVLITLNIYQAHVPAQDGTVDGRWNDGAGVLYWYAQIENQLNEIETEGTAADPHANIFFIDPTATTAQTTTTTTTTSADNSSIAILPEFLPRDLLGNPVLIAGFILVIVVLVTGMMGKSKKKGLDLGKITRNVQQSKALKMPKKLRKLRKR